MGIGIGIGIENWLDQVLESELVSKAVECIGIRILKITDTIHLSTLVRKMLRLSGPRVAFPPPFLVALSLVA